MVPEKNSERWDSMKSSLHNIRTRRFAGVGSLVAGFAISIGALSAAQQPAPNGVEIQRDAMHKLAFLAGRWSGPGYAR